LTSDDVYTEEHNAFVSRIPNHILAIAFAIKSNYKPEMGDDWKSFFGVDITNGVPGHELKFKNRFISGSYLRVGTRKDVTWRNYKLRQGEFCDQLDHIAQTLDSKFFFLPPIFPSFLNHPRLYSRCQSPNGR
jgi:hypothetical protein